MASHALDCLIEVSPAETRIARIDEDGVLHHFDVSRLDALADIGGIYQGRVVRIEKSMDAAFIDIGLGEMGLLNRAKGLHQGEPLIVQVTRAGRDGKGPALTRRPCMKGRYLLYTPARQDALTFPKTLGQGAARAELETDLTPIFDGKQGYVLRKPALAVGTKHISKEADRLLDQWNAILEKSKTATSLGLLHAGEDVLGREILDAEPEGRIAIDDRQAHYRLEKLIASQYPDLGDGLLFHKGPESIFAASGVEEQLDEALSRRVEIGLGASIVFDRTEALTIIDVNMGGAGNATGVGVKKGDAIFRLNQTAAAEIARHIILRNLSGLILIDFLSMKSTGPQKGRSRQLVGQLRSKLTDGERPVDVLGLTSAGLMEITRQRGGVVLEDLFFTARPAGHDTNPDAQAAAILRHAVGLRGAGQPVAYASQPVIDVLNNRYSAALDDVAQRLGRSLDLREGCDETPPIVKMD